jgi:hypothetical protein
MRRWRGKDKREEDRERRWREEMERGDEKKKK